MSNYLQPISLGISLFILSSVSFAADIRPMEGRWAITSSLPEAQRAAMVKMPPEAMQQMRKQGMEIDAKAGTMTVTQCLDRAKLEQWHQMGQEPNTKCEKPKIVQQGNTVTMDMKCSQPRAATMHSVITFSNQRDQYQFEHLIKAEGQEMRMKGHAKRTGACQ
ncbi:DUF3617 family protein [Chitinibacter sp. FCG-7]|uniref:DUF3617 family protein n=1 Tax=Chitinibacter mangrovi TaxID=3153927 RepID=A0AAU7FBY0_9NEIS